MRILVTGGAGMLGSSLVPELARAGHELVVTDIDRRIKRPWGARGPTIGLLDVRDRGQIQEAFAEVRPELVVHLAAMTDLENCERDPDRAFHVNAVGTKFIALECQRAEIPMGYVSTAGVFDGEKTSAYTEYDKPNPINVYGHSKFEGERYVVGLLDRYYLVRAGWMVGGGADKDHKFVARILRQLREGRRTIYAVGDKLGTPTYTPDFARCFTRVIESGSYGLYHMACEGWGSRYDVAKRILEVLERDDVELVEVGSEHFAEEFFAPRPRSEIMRNLVLELEGNNLMRPWTVAIQEYLATAFRGWSRSTAAGSAAS